MARLYLAAPVPDWCNPLVVGRHKEPAHATLLDFLAPTARCSRHPTSMMEWEPSPFVKQLGGRWRLAFALLLGSPLPATF